MKCLHRACMLNGQRQSEQAMPRVSAFYGIAIYMYYRDHPPPHFHAIYDDFDAEVGIIDGEIIEGELPARAERLVQDWASQYHAELMDNWQRARAGDPLEQIPPLD